MVLSVVEALLILTTVHSNAGCSGLTVASRFRCKGDSLATSKAADHFSIIACAAQGHERVGWYRPFRRDGIDCPNSTETRWTFCGMARPHTERGGLDR
ncbi:hypothetical protein BDW66DRAFT_127509 [Aspergillus desertorum]